MANIKETRSLGALQAPTSSGGPSGLLTSSVVPFGRSGRVTHATMNGYYPLDSVLAI